MAGVDEVFLRHIALDGRDDLLVEIDLALAGVLPGHRDAFDLRPGLLGLRLLALELEEVRPQAVEMALETGEILRLVFERLLQEPVALPDLARVGRRSALILELLVGLESRARALRLAALGDASRHLGERDAGQEGSVRPPALLEVGELLEQLLTRLRGLAGLETPEHPQTAQVVRPLTLVTLPQPDHAVEHVGPIGAGVVRVRRVLLGHLQGRPEDRFLEFLTEQFQGVVRQVARPAHPEAP